MDCNVIDHEVNRIINYLLYYIWKSVWSNQKIERVKHALVYDQSQT